MSNFPDGMRNFDEHPDSPFYEDGEEVNEQAEESAAEDKVDDRDTGMASIFSHKYGN